MDVVKLLIFSCIELTLIVTYYTKIQTTLSCVNVHAIRTNNGCNEIVVTKPISIVR